MASATFTLRRYSSAKGDIRIPKGASIEFCYKNKPLGLAGKNTDAPNRGMGRFSKRDFSGQAKKVSLSPTHGNHRSRAFLSSVHRKTERIESHETNDNDSCDGPAGFEPAHGGSRGTRRWRRLWPRRCSHRPRSYAFRGDRPEHDARLR